MAIRSIKHKGLRRLYETGDPRGVRAAFVDKIRDMLFALDTAEAVDEIEKVPGWRLHPLRGDLRGLWSLSVSGNRRLIFRFEAGDAHDLDLVDYH